MKRRVFTTLLGGVLDKSVQGWKWTYALHENRGSRNARRVAPSRTRRAG
jgi:hypothetical protein